MINIPKKEILYIDNFLKWDTIQKEDTMHIIAKRTLREFWEKPADVETV